MSNWIEITDPEDIDIDDTDINILYGFDDFGNNYIHINREMFLNRLAELGCSGVSAISLADIDGVSSSIENKGEDNEA